MIGGSALGPLMVTEALIPYTASNLKLHSVSVVDAKKLYEALHMPDPATTFLSCRPKLLAQKLMHNQQKNGF